ncbi:MAG: 3-methyl-2-oxobutanoate hydroxymethyltransferase [Hydrotalea sp.]|nr:3-methyl-2-oxobutanoate hydroxymethyltransferase [Hydrotalea sp.]
MKLLWPSSLINFLFFTTLPANTIPALQAMKGREKIVVLSLYTHPMAALCAPATDVLLVGDSLGMVLYGFDSTLPVTLEMMIRHGQAVRAGAPESLVVIDMPFGTVEKTTPEAIANCRRVMQETTAHDPAGQELKVAGVKIEGGKEMAETIGGVVSAGIPVMGHVGLLPQRAKQLGGFKAQGIDKKDWPRIIDDALAVERAGAFAIVVEAVAAGLGREITNAVKIPTIGIGAGADCDGQVLVADDMLGITYHQRKKPRFVRQFATLDKTIQTATSDFAQAVKNGDFPRDEETYKEKN